MTLTTTKSITLNASGIVFDSSFKTVVTKVISPDDKSFIILDSLPNVQISLGGESATSLGIEKNSQVTIKPIDGSTDGSFTLEVGEKQAVKKPAAPKPKGSSPGRHMTFSNAL